METAQPQRKNANGMSIFSTIVGTLIGFLAGIYIGVHPQWIPVKGIVPADDSTDTPTKTMSGPSIMMPVQPATLPVVPTTQAQ